MGDSEPFWSRRLIRAFLTALLLHVGAWLLFQVDESASPLSEAQAIVMADVELGSQPLGREGSEVPLAEGVGLLPRYLLLPDAEQPELPTIPLLGTESRQLPRRDVDHAREAFGALERQAYRPDHSDFSFVEWSQPVTLTLKGPASELKIEDLGLGRCQERQRRYEPLQRHFLSFDIQIDRQTGCVFVIEPRHLAATPSLNHLARNILRSMRFEKTEKATVTRGTVEFLLELSDCVTVSYLEGLQRPAA
jgi:hypothetical protein